MHPSDKPSPTELAKRIRSGIIDYLETAASYEHQRDYQRSVPKVCVPSEMINQWEDWVTQLDAFPEPVFSPTEQAAIRQFHGIWHSVTKDTPKILPPLSQLTGTEPWERLRHGAELALKIFEVRGRLNDERDASSG